MFRFHRRVIIKTSDKDDANADAAKEATAAPTVPQAMLLHASTPPSAVPKGEIDFETLRAYNPGRDTSDHLPCVRLLKNCICNNGGTGEYREL